MAKEVKEPVSAAKQNIPHGLTVQDLRAMYKAMVLTRAYDERGFKLQRQGRIGFYAGSFGEEACQIGTAYATQPQDWIFSSYRQPGIALLRGVPMQTMMNNLFGNAEDVVQGRQMPVHYTGYDQHFLSVSSVIGTQVIQGVGCAMAARYKGDDAAVLTYMGDGGTSSNDFHSGMNFAGVFKAPVVFILVNNQFAISIPVSRQTACETLADKAVAYGMPGFQIDGNDILAVYGATKEAIERARAGEGPTLLELKTYRAGPHSSSDDPSRYRDQKVTDQWLERDPLAVFKAQLESFGVWAEDWHTEAEEDAKAMIAQAISHAEKIGEPDWTSLFNDVTVEKSQVLALQEQDILAHERGLDLKNEGAFPL